MSESPATGIWSRLRGARLPRVLVGYAAASWLILQLTALLRQEFGLPSWVTQLSVVLLLIGFVILAATAWVQSHPQARARAEREEVPGAWELDLGEVKESVSRGRLPHLTWSRSILGGVVAFSLLFGIAGLYLIVKDRGRSFGPQPAMAGPEPALAVLPFRVVGEGTDLWREGMVDLLSTNLDGAAGIRTVAPRTVLSRWRSAVPEGTEVSDSAAAQVARDLHARYALLGSMVSLGGEVRLTARVQDLQSGEELGEAEVRGVPDSIPALVDRLSLEVLQQALERAASLTRVDLRRLTSTSLPALKAYLTGEQLFRRSHFDEAIAAFTTAVEEDSTFALAAYRLSLAHAWSSIAPPEGAFYAERAVQFADRLGERDAALVRGYGGLERGETASIAALRELVARYPDDAEAWYLLGETQYHLGDVLLLPPEEFEKSLRQALQLDPSFSPAYIHLSDGMIARDDTAGLRRLMGEWGRVDSTSAHLTALRIAFDLAFGDAAARERGRRALGSASTRAVEEASLALLPSDEWGARWTTAEAMLDERHPTEVRDAGRSQQAWLRLVGGRAREALEIRRLMSQQDSPTDLARIRLAAATAMGYYAGPDLSKDADLLAAQGAPDAWDRYVLAGFAVRENRLPDAEREIRAFETAPWPPSWGADTMSIAERKAAARVLRGFLAAGAGDTTRAIREIESALPEVRGACPGTWCQNHKGSRFQFGRLLLAGGEAKKAQRYLRSVGPWPTASLYVAQAHEAVGQLEEAREHYARFVEAFRDSDPELRPLLEQGQAGLARLSELKRL